MQLRELEYRYNGILWAAVWDPNKAIDIGGVVDMWRWSVCLKGFTVLFSEKNQFVSRWFDPARVRTYP